MARVNQEQFEKVRTGQGFIAALDQSGGSTPKALKLYGIGEDAYSNDAEMYDVIHEARTRIVTSKAFTGDPVVRAVLVDINSPEKAQAEALLMAAILGHLDDLAADQHVMLKLTLPEQDDFYQELVQHPKVLKVVALSGGYSREEANARLARNHGVIASFSRALTEGLSAQQSDEEFDAALDEAVGSIFAASNT